MKKNKLKLFLIIYFICAMLPWIIGALLSIDKEVYIKISIISFFLIVIPILLIIVGGFGYFLYQCMKSLVKSKKKIYIIPIIIYAISIFLVISGIIIIFLETNIYDVDQVQVIDVRDNKILVDYSKYNHGDNKIIEIHKPFFANIKEGDIIDVRYPINDPLKMHYVICSDFGQKLLAIGLVMQVVITIIFILFVFIKYIVPIIKK